MSSMDMPPANTSVEPETGDTGRRQSRSHGEDGRNGADGSLDDDGPWIRILQRQPAGRALRRAGVRVAEPPHDDGDAELGRRQAFVQGTFTLEPATIPPEGSRELFQRGETYDGVLLIDRQHPHDSLRRARGGVGKARRRGAELRFYLAPIGEPALGPVSYPHRSLGLREPDGSARPSQPGLDAHRSGRGDGWMETTRFSRSRAPSSTAASPTRTAGTSIRKDRLVLGQTLIRPTPELAFQLSSGHLEHPEAIEEGNQTRSTASLGYQKALPGGFIAATLIAGRNRTPDGPEWGNLLEWTWKFAGANFIYGRIESVDRDLFELTSKRQRPPGVPPDRTNVQSLTLGYVRDVRLFSGAETGLGLDGTDLPVHEPFGPCLRRASRVGARVSPVAIRFGQPCSRGA